MTYIFIGMHLNISKFQNFDPLMNWIVSILKDIFGFRLLAIFLNLYKLFSNIIGWIATKVIIHKLCGGLSLVEQDTIKYLSWPI